MTQKEPTLSLGSTLTDDEVASYLREHPDFFERYPSVLSELSVPHVQSGPAISLVERQTLVLRERIRSMELKLAEMLRHGQENDAISNSMQRWIRGLLLHGDDRSLPEHLSASLAEIFSVPQSGIALWQASHEWADEPWFMRGAPDYAEQIDRMMSPMCGPVSLSPSSSLLPDGGSHAQSIAVIPLRVGAAPQAYGVLVLGSPDPKRFGPDLGVAFLERIGEIASAALQRAL